MTREDRGNEVKGKDKVEPNVPPVTHSLRTTDVVDVAAGPRHLKLHM